MQRAFLITLKELENLQVEFESRVPPPQRVPLMDSFVFRYVEKTPQQALVQKLVRNVSGLYAARILCEAGFFQEQASLERVLDELHEDITFLAYGMSRGALQELHHRYLDAFYEEEFDRPEDPLASTQKRPSIPRQKIRAYIAQFDEHPIDQSRANELSRTLSKVYSGFVHAASPQIMDMYGGNPSHFHVSGMLGTPGVIEYTLDLRDYFYRGIMAFGFAAMAFGDNALYSRVIALRDGFEKTSGLSVGEPNQALQSRRGLRPRG
jgi:hypothetical protein